MTTPRTILRESLIVLPLLAALSAVASGVEALVPVLLAGVLSVANFAALAWAMHRMMNEEAVADPTGIIIVKTTGSLLAWTGLMLNFDPMWVLVGANTVLIGIVTRGALDALTSVMGGPALAEET